MARTDYGAILSTVIKDTSDAVREVNGTSSLIAPNQWGTAIRTMHSDSDYENALEQMIEETATGDIASFSDGANNIPCPSVLCTINPVQDLHGQDNPYPSGGGKNKASVTDINKPSWYNAGWSGTSLNANHGITQERSYMQGGCGGFVETLKAGTYTISCDVSNTSIDYCSGIYYSSDGITLNTIYAPATLFQVTGTRRCMSFTLPVDAEVCFRATAKSFPSGTTSVSLTNIQIESGSTATPYAPYSNICPISGWSSVNVTRTGANLWDEEWQSGAYSIETGAYFIANDRIASANFIPIKANSTYSIVAPYTGTFDVLYYDANKSYIGYKTNRSDRVFTTPTNCYYINISVWSTYGTTYNHDISINYPSSDTSYHAYTGSTTTTDLGTTVYGGTLEVVSGVLTIDRAIVDLSTFTLGTLGDVYIWYKEFDNILVPASNSEIGQVISEYYAPIRYNSVSGTPNTIAIRTNAYMYVNTGGNTTPQGNAVYKLATPTTIQLTPQEVKSLLGSNNIYHDCNGQVAVTYKANGELYVEQHT